MFDSGHMTLCTHGQMFLHKNTRSSLWIISSRNFRFWHMTLNFWAQEEHYLFVCLLLCVALPVFYILAHLCVAVLMSQSFICSQSEKQMLFWVLRTAWSGNWRRSVRRSGQSWRKWPRAAGTKHFQIMCILLIFSFITNSNPKKKKTEPNQVHARY